MATPTSALMRVPVATSSSMRVSRPYPRGVAVGVLRAGAARCTSSAFRPRLSPRLLGHSPRCAARANHTTSAAISEESPPPPAEVQDERPRHVIRAEERQKQQVTYLVAACAASLGISATAVVATWYRFSVHTLDGSPFPYGELFLSLLFTVGAAVGMEMYARYAHKGLWHETWMWELPVEWRADWNKSFWYLHKSHHEPREGAFEQNDIFAVANALPAIGLILYGFLHEGVMPGLAYGAGLGITIFGMAYMFVHDGMVHRRFPVGPIADVPYFKKVAMAHKLHHSEKFAGVPYGLFFAIQELEQCEGGLEELDQMLLAAELREVAAKQAMR